MQFIHFTTWSQGNKATWVPVNKRGVVIPHVYGHIVDCELGDLLLPDWRKHDIYQVIEKVERQIDLLGNAVFATPTGFKPWDGQKTAWPEERTYCDYGCLDCEYAYTRIVLETRPISGVFAVAKGAKVFDLIKMSAGNSCFPHNFVLSAPLRRIK